jgi:hypothetical protein
VRAVYEKGRWLFFSNTRLVDEYNIAEVPIEYILQKAYEAEQIPSPELKSLNETDYEKTLEWFNEFFATKECGAEFLRMIREGQPLPGREEKVEDVETDFVVGSTSYGSVSHFQHHGTSAFGLGVEGEYLKNTSASMPVVAYIQKTPGHKNSKGEDAPWTIRDHETGEILQSFKTKEEAEKALRRMQYFKHTSSEN